MSWKKTDERLIKLGMHIFSGAGKFLDFSEISIASAMNVFLPLRQLSGVIRNLFQG